MGDEIKKVAVLGAGVMGQGIAAHLANAGIPSVLFDIVPRGLDEGASPAERNKAALDGLTNLAKSKPAALFHKSFSNLITPANYDDHGHLLADCDWIVEVVVELLPIPVISSSVSTRTRCKANLREHGPFACRLNEP